MTANFMNLKGIPVAKFSSKSEKRTETMNEFINGQYTLAFATNILSRGINIDKVQVVINFELPRHQTFQDIDIKRYIHRIGRACSFNREGLAINLVGPEEREMHSLAAKYPEIMFITH